MPIPARSPRDIDGLRRAGAILWSILTRAAEACIPDVTTGRLDRLISELIERAGATAVLRGYQQPGCPPFPSAATVCINEEVVQAVPGNRIVRDGDVVTIDAALALDGWHADAARTVIAGNAAPERVRLAAAARRGTELAIAALQPGVRWSSVAAQVAAWAGQEGLGLVTEYIGHGIGRALHEAPACAWGGLGPKAGQDFILRPGMCLAVEPVFVLGGPGVVGLDDGLTSVTADRSAAAYEERTVAITRRGPVVLTGE